MSKPRVAMFVVGAALIGLAAVASPVDVTRDRPAESTRTATLQTGVVRVDPWMLHDSSGAALYQQLCASCHGVDATGDGRAARSLSVPAPPLDRLRETGVRREHWTYVLRAPCEDPHHWGPDGAGTMPCWQRIFRQTLGNGAAPTLISQKLVDYLEIVQK